MSMPHLPSGAVLHDLSLGLWCRMMCLQCLMIRFTLIDGPDALQEALTAKKMEFFPRPVIYALPTCSATVAVFCHVLIYSLCFFSIRTL